MVLPESLVKDIIGYIKLSASPLPEDEVDAYEKLSNTFHKAISQIIDKMNIELDHIIYNK